MKIAQCQQGTTIVIVFPSQNIKKKGLTNLVVLREDGQFCWAAKEINDRPDTINKLTNKATKQYEKLDPRLHAGAAAPDFWITNCPSPAVFSLDPITIVLAWSPRMMSRPEVLVSNRLFYASKRKKKSRALEQLFFSSERDSPQYCIRIVVRVGFNGFGHDLS